MNMEFVRKLAIPMEVKELYPLTGAMANVIEQRQAEINAIFSGRSDKFALIIGPCSADNEESVIDYIHRLARVQAQVAEKVCIIPRIYTNKPRTTGDGYKGLLHQPDPVNKPDMFKGIIATRKLHMRAIQETGLTCADEMLYAQNHKYLDDLLAYVAIGARSVEDQEHRLTASGIEVPVGMKNPTSGDLKIMMNAITAAQHRHTFIYRGWEAHSMGNPYAHAILRGYVDKFGKSHPNYHYEDLITLAGLYAESGLQNPACIVDTNHANSNKCYLEQPRIVSEVLHCCRHNDDIRRMVKGFMIESYLEDGAQKVGDSVFGKSITDPCLGWDKTEELICRIADQL